MSFPAQFHFQAMSELLTRARAGRLGGRFRTVAGLGLVLALLTLSEPVRAQASPEMSGSISASRLAEAIAQAEPGDTIIVEGGTYHGQLVVDKTLILIGRNWPVIDGGGRGTLLTLESEGSAVSGFVLRNSGDSLDEENSGIVAGAPRITIRDNRFEDTLFGIYVRQAPGSVVAGNVIASKNLDVPRRGDAIRVWSSNDVTVEGNEITRGRDVVLWYSERLTLRNNTFRDSRYGLHFMYCDDALIEGNRLLNNSVGTYLMYSRRLVMRNNTVAGNRGPSGFGIGLKDLDDYTVTGNLFLDNRVGAYFDGSPREVDSVGHISGNVFAYNDIGIELTPSVRHNEFTGNSFIDNEEQVVISGGGGRVEANAWTVDGRGNYWSDYAGYDAGGDGLGDLPYRSDRLFESLMGNQPSLRLFLHSPATNALDFAARAFPMVKPQPKLVDELPLMSPQLPASAPTLAAGQQTSWLWMASALVALSLILIGLPRLGRGRFHFPTAQPPTPRVEVSQ